ncbi:MULTISPECIES: ElyC/SanA/YdcF family protein [Streptomyces]|uniref:SanA/YdcF family protein n=1 Tax=Streptomyces TaxID=1883 RepID=UPI00140C2DAE|nr:MULTISPECIES: ElyC/SanA/YdcF family protein [Streptomyces]MDH6227105.1 vancomycin permeability regulator SanA [Streptomyces sp. MJP52]
MPRLPRTRVGRRRLVRAAVAVCALALLPYAWVYTAADGRLRAPGEVPETGVAMVFGAGLWGDEPSPYLAHRLDTAAELYADGRIRAVLVTGDNSREEYDEPDAMRAYLVEHGVPDSRIVSDYAGFDTWDSCARAKRVFGVDEAVLITQGFHVRRAVALCEEAGIASYGVAATGDRRDGVWYYGAARETLAAGKAALDALVEPDPMFLGPREHGVERALTRP